jgi:hypothetical protein
MSDGAEVRTSIFLVRVDQPNRSVIAASMRRQTQKSAKYSEKFSFSQSL